MATPSCPPHSIGMLLQSAIQSVDTSRWNAVVARDRAAAGTFVYAVRSTGVYCRPGCASRRPRRDRVDFFDTPADAERAGFRPCRRCRPREAAQSDPWIERIRRACVYLANVEGHLPLASLARRLGGSLYHLQRNFKRIVGITPRHTPRPAVNSASGAGFAAASRSPTRRWMRASDRAADCMNAPCPSSA